MVHRLTARAGIALLVLAFSSNLFASEAPSCELNVREAYRFYEISGNSLDQLREQINLKGTKWNDGKTYSALTNWDIHYKYRVTRNNGRYSVRSADTSVDISYYLPKLNVDSCTPDLAQRWKDYLAHLQRHEYGHKDLAVQTASQVNEMFATLPTFATEEELAAEITKRTEEKFRQLKEIQIDYDRDTRHGETQGAVLLSGGGA